MIRIHLSQIFFNPAFFDQGFDLLEEPAPSLDTTNALGNLRRIEEIENLLIDLRGTYVEHIKTKLREVLRWSHSRGANIVVFPEYSVPAEALPLIRDVAMQDSLCVVAGTHRVQFSQNRLQVCGAIGISTASIANGSAVAPVIHPTGTVTLSTKNSRSKWEPNLNVSAQGGNIHQVTLNGTLYRIAVVPCIDSLNLEEIGSVWSTGPAKPHILVCPSLSPTTGLFAQFGQILAANEAVFVFVNSADFGGTDFNLPQEWQQYAAQAKCANRPLIPAYEGILEIDVDPDCFFLKKGSVVATPPCSGIKEFPIVYELDCVWIHKYRELRKDVLELLEGNDTAGAVEFIDAALSEQEVPFPEDIASRLKMVRHCQIPAFSGNTQAVEEAMTLAEMGNGLEDSLHFFAWRVRQTMQVVTKAIHSTRGEMAYPLIDYLKALKKTEKTLPSLDDVPTTGVVAAAEMLAKSVYRPLEYTVASFQDRGQQLDELKEIVSRGSERVVVISGMPGIGKTETTKTFFLKVLMDWKPVWISVASGSSVARLVAEIGYALGVTMDIDSLSTATESVFRQKVRKLMSLLFNTEKNALIVDDLRDLRTSMRDFHHLKALVEEASKVEKYVGSRLILISSVTLPAIWIHRAGVARVHIKGLDEVYAKRVLEYQLRSSGLVSGETEPDIPQALLELIGGHPLAAIIAAEASRKEGLASLGEMVLDQVTAGLISLLLPKIELAPEELQTARAVSVFRLPIERGRVEAIIGTNLMDKLASHAILDFDGLTYMMHPVVRKFFYARIPSEKYADAHRVAASYYERLDEERTYAGRRNINHVAEMAYHLSLAGELRRASELRACVFDEIAPAAKLLYSQRRYHLALQLFMKLAELRPDDPNTWAYVGRCHARRGQWDDCDAAFVRANEVARAAKQPIWWIYRDWGQIRARYGFYPVATKHFQKAKEFGATHDPSLIASQAYVDWKEGRVEEAKRGFDLVLRLDPDHSYTLDTYARLLAQEGDETGAAALRKRLESVRGELLVPKPYDMEVEDDAELEE